MAIKNAKHVAIDLAKSMGMAVGKPVKIEEKSTQEIYGNSLRIRDGDVIVDKKLIIRSAINSFIEEKTISYKVNIHVTFNLKKIK